MIRRIRRAVRRFGVVPVALASLGLAVPAAVAVAPAAPAAASVSASSIPVSVAAPVTSQTVTVLGHGAHGAHGTMEVHTYSKRAGSCSLYVDWTGVYGSANTGVKSQFWVKAYIDECSGGGTLKYQSELICDATQPGHVYYDYGPWRSDTSQGSNVTQGNGCWEAANGPDNGYPDSGSVRENMNNPTRIQCWNGNTLNGRTVHGSNCGTTT